MNEEIFDVCDENDRVIGQAARSVVHREGLRHRAVHIWVWNSRDELLIHLRSHTKDEFPNCYTSSASGHVDAGETYEFAAHRELKEELGLTGELQEITRLPAGPETANEHTVLFFLRTDAHPQPDPVEIARVDRFSLPEIERLLQAEPERLTPPFRALLHWWLNNNRPLPA